ncbi:MAG: hypothetical protein B0D92_06490 [Spirochaeta sp. LUC14_002_19_P3]|nr:MAG: hypothetical protein B0D92_06490 [Spirochaeta sp. LUC14_002_19_P3]
MYIVIIGAGLVGWRLAKQLVSEGKEVTLIEKNPDEARRANDRLDCQVLVGEGNSLPMLEQAGVKRADFFISVTESDEVNMIACSLVAAEYPDPVTVARVRSLAYSTTRMVRQRLYGIDYIINPEIEAARAVIRSLEHGAVGIVNPFRESGLIMTSVTVDKSSPLINRTVREIRLNLGGNFLIPLIFHNAESFVPSGDTVINSGDMLYIIADNESTDRFLHAIGMRRRELRRIAIAGGGRIGRYVAEYLLGAQEGSSLKPGPWSRIIKRMKNKASGRSVHFIERDYEVCRELAELFPGALITNADISDEEVGETGLLEGCDLLVSATGNQELNIISSMFAKTYGVTRTISLVRKAAYVSMAQKMGIDVTVSVTDTMVDSILSILRRGNIRSIYTIAGSDYEIIDFHLNAKSPLVGSMVKDIKLPKDSLILVVHRGETYHLPGGDFEIIPDDRIVVIMPQDSVEKLEEAVVGS